MGVKPVALDYEKPRRRLWRERVLPPLVFAGTVCNLMIFAVNACRGGGWFSIAMLPVSAWTCAWAAWTAFKRQRQRPRPGSPYAAPRRGDASDPSQHDERGIARSADERSMRALSIRQPFAELILMGVKRIEYRSWATRL